MTTSQPTPAKITRPQTPRVYLRTRLFDALDEARRNGCVWITGPPGAGKTTLAASYLQDRKLDHLWYRIDEGDVDVANFFYYLGLAAKKASRRRKYLPLFTSEYALGLPTFTRRFFEQLYSWLKPPFVIILDNYQLAPFESPLHNIVCDAVEGLPEGGSFVIVSRQPPPSEFARLRANQHLKAIDWQSLKIDLEETRGIAELRTEQPLSGELVQQLQTRTEGWIAGLVLLMEGPGSDKDMSRSVSSEKPQTIFDYFAAEVFERRPVAVREFLMQMSLFPRVSPALAQKMSGYPNAAKILGDLYKDRYFTECDNEDKPHYQFHPLFSNFLLARLEESRTPVEFGQLRHRAAQLLESDGQVEQALELFLVAGDWAETSRLICQCAQELVIQGRGATLQRWIGRIPNPVVQEVAWLQFWLGASQLMASPLDARTILEKSYERFKQESDVAGTFLSITAIIETFIFGWGNFTPLDHWITELEVLIKNQSDPLPTEIQGRVAVAMFCAVLYRQQDPGKLEYWIDQVQGVMQNHSDPGYRIMIGLHLATHYVWRGLHRDAELLLEELRPLVNGADVMPGPYIMFHGIQGMYLCRALSEDPLVSALKGLECAESSGIYVLNNLLLGWCVNALLEKSDVESCVPYLSKMESVLHPARILDQGFYHWLRGWGSWVRGNSDEALHHVEKCWELTKQGGSPFHDNMVRICLAKVLVDRGQTDEAQSHVNEILPRVHAMQNKTLEYEVLLVQACVEFASGDDKAGLEHLRKSLSLMRKLEAATVVWWNPPVVMPLLATALANGIEVNYVQHLIRLRGLEPGPKETLLENWPWPVQLHTLGSFAVTVDGEVLQSEAKGRKKPLELLKAVVAFGGSDVGEGRLIDALWPQSEGDAAYHSLKTTVHRLRKMLRSEQALRVHDGQVTLCSRHCWVDTWTFQRFMNGGKTVGNGDDRIQALEQAIALYKGPFLASDGDEVWLLAPREKLRSQFQRAITHLAEYWEDCDDWGKAANCYKQGIEADELAEIFYQNLIRCQNKLGQTSEGLATYERCHKMLAAKFGIEPSKKTKAIAEQINKSP